MDRSPRTRTVQKPNAASVKSPLTICVSPVSVKPADNRVSKHVRTRSQRETEKVRVSDEIKSQTQVRFEVAVSLSTEFSSAKSETKVIKKSQNTAQRTVLHAVDQNSPRIKKSGPERCQIKKPTPKVVCSPSMSIDKTPQTNIKNLSTSTGAKFKNKTKNKAAMKGVTDEEVLPSPKLMKTSTTAGGKRKRTEAENRMFFSPSPKKWSGESASSFRPQLAQDSPTWTSKPKTDTTLHQHTPKRQTNHVSSTKSQQLGSRKTPQQMEKQSQARSPAFLKRHIHQSPRPEGCMSPKRKPGTPWRECQLRKLAEEQKAAKESMKQTKEKEWVTSPKRPNGKVEACPDDKAGESHEISKDPVKQPMETETDAGSMNDQTADEKKDAGMVTSPSGSDVDHTNPCSPSVDSSSQTNPSKTVLSRFKTKLTQSYERTVEYFQEVKHIWDDSH